MRRFLLVVAAAYWLLASTTLLRAQTTTESQFAAKLSPAELKIEIALAKRVKISYPNETPVKEVIADLAKQADLPIELDPEGFEEADVVPEQLVTLELGDFPLRQGLDVLLGPLHLGYRLTESGLVITSEEVCAEQPMVRIYPVLDLVRTRDFPGVGETLDFDTLIDTITSHLSPDTWTDNGGASQIGAGPGGCIVVAQTYTAHQEVEHLLIGLRQLKSDHAKLKAGETAPVIDFGSGNKIRQALNKRDTTTLDIELKFYVRDVAKVVGCPILLDPEGLEEADVTADQMIHVAYRNARIGDVFRQTLSKLHLRYVVQDGYIAVTSHEKEAEQHHTRIYPIGDLVPLRAIEDPPIRDFDTLIDFITSGTREAHAWVNHGGGCTVSAWQEPAAVIISAYDEIHDDVEQLLAKLRQTDIAAFNAEQAKADQRIVERIYPLYMARRAPAAKAAKAETDKADKEGEAKKPAEAIPTADDVAKLIEELLPEVSFKEKGTLLRPFHDRLIVRHRPAMLHKIEKLLEKIDAWPPHGQGGMGGGGVF